jgi:protein TonB
MERPSHRISTLSLQPGSRRLAGAGISVIAQLGFVAALIGGVVVRDHFKPPQPFEVKELERVEQRTPPPPIKVERPALPIVAAPLIDIAPAENGGATITTVTPPVTAQNPPTVTRQPPPQAAVPDRAATAIPGTHTTPPYPALARRLGAEGKVTLRLTVAPDGTVKQAEVVTSSGRQDLDQAAQQWLVTHWTYRPAIRDGAPATAQVLAAVQFSLTASQ